MPPYTIPDRIGRQLSRDIAELARRGITVEYAIEDDHSLVSIIIREQREDIQHCNGERDLWDLAVNLFSEVNLLKEVRAFPCHTYVVEGKKGNLVFRRLVTPEFESKILAGPGSYGFEIGGEQYNLESPPDFIHDHMEFFAKEVKDAVERQNLVDQLP